MYGMKMFYFLVLLATFVVMTGCSKAPATATQAPVAVEPTRRPTEPMVTATLEAASNPIATEPPIAATATPVETDFIATKPEEIAGFWQFSAFGSLMHIDFHPDGSVYSNRMNSKDKPWGATFWFEGTLFHYEDLACSPDGTKPTQGTYEAHVVQEDGHNYKLYFKPIQDLCKDRKNEMKKGYIWVGPVQ